MSRRASQRGLTLVEVMMAMAILAMGVGAAATVVISSARQGRRVLAQSQALMVAETELERLRAVGCDGSVPTDPCANLEALDGNTHSAWWSASGGLMETPVPGLREYHVALDVDPPFEGDERGEPDLRRALAGTGPGQQVNLRVTVSWDEEGGSRRVVAFQTRVAP